MEAILRVDSGGIPDDWIDYERAVAYYATDTVAWTHGDPVIEFRGGTNAITGLQSKIAIHPIIAVKSDAAMRGAASRLESTPPLSNPSLFKRDRYTCAYCGDVHPGNHRKMLTRDHILARSRGGEDRWMNVVTACKSCNHRKGQQGLDELRWKLLYVPYAPNLFEGLLLKGRHILACHHEFLSGGLPKHSRFLM